jgi:hypothetical protein
VKNRAEDAVVQSARDACELELVEEVREVDEIERVATAVPRMTGPI